MDIDKIASIMSEDISVNNGVIFERDVSVGRAQKKAMGMKKFYDQMWNKLMKTYQKNRQLGQEHEEAMAGLKSKIEGGFQKTGGYEKIPLDKKHKIKEIYNKINDTGGDLPVEKKPGPSNFAELVSTMKKSEPKKVKVAGRTIDVELEQAGPVKSKAFWKDLEAENKKKLEARAKETGRTPEEQLKRENLKKAEIDKERKESGRPWSAEWTDKQADIYGELEGLDDKEVDARIAAMSAEDPGTAGAPRDPERTGGVAGIEQEKAKALAAAKEKKKQQAAAAAEVGAGAREVAHESMAYNDISIIAENICDINRMNGTISEAINSKIAAATLKSYNEKGVQGTETYYEPREYDEFSKLLNSIWTRIVKGNATIDGVDLVSISRSGDVFSPEKYQKVLHIVTALKDQKLPPKMSKELANVETPSVEEADEMEKERVETMQKEDPEGYQREVLGIKKGEKSAKQAGSRLNQLVKNARVGDSFRIKIPDTDKKAGGAVAKITVRESIMEEFEHLEEINGDIMVILVA